MKNPEIFRILHKETSKAIDDIANFIGADPDLVSRCFWVSGVAGYDAPGHLDAVKDVTHSFNAAARHARNLHRALTIMTPSQRKELEVSGCVTHYQVEHLADILAQDAKSLHEWSRTRLRTGGRNPAAYGIARSIRCLFRRMRKEITFGQHPDGGPSTDFGKTVQFAIGAFGIKADWRRPAQEEREKQIQINERYYRIKGTRPKPSLLKKPDCVNIQIEKAGKDRTYVFSADSRQDLEPHRVCACRFQSGAEVEHYAAVWFSSLNANS